MSDLWSALDGRQVIVCAGAGGVGKTTTSAALGLALAREGRRVLVLTVDPARRLADALGHDLGPDASAVDLEGEPPFDAAMLHAPTSFSRLVSELPVSSADRERLRSSRITRELTGGDAGMQELMAVIELGRLADAGRYDAIVLDTPPALHALELLDGPERIVGLLSGRTVRTIGRASGLAGRMGRLPGPGRALGRLWGAELLAEIAAFLEAARPFGEQLSDALDRVEALLRSPAAAFALVTAPAPDPLATAGELATALRRRGYPVAGTIVNRRRSPHDDASDLPTAIAALSDRGLTRSAELVRHLAAVTEIEDAVLRTAGLPEPRLEIAEQPPSDDPVEVLSSVADALRGAA